MPIAAAVRAAARILVPAFDITFAYSGTPVLARHVLIGNTVPMSLVPFASAQADDFLLCIRWAVGPLAFRYKLWENADVKFPLYAGQEIPADISYLEVWGIDDSGTATLSSELAITTSILASRSTCSPCNAVDANGNSYASADDMSLTLETIPVLPADTECNPFCFPLC